VNVSFAASRTGVQGGAILALKKEEMPDMALLDVIVDGYFRNEKAGRVVIFPRRFHSRGYVVRSEAEELRIRSFLKMFYFAYFSILLFGYCLAYESSRELSYALGSPARHLLRTGGIFLGICSLFMGVPYWLLWRSYKKEFQSFVSVEDQVVLSGKSASRRHWSVSAGLIGLAILILVGAFLLVRSKSVR
jgi:hypothetical protein